MLAPGIARTIAGPIALVAAVTIWLLADRLLGIGPLDRAQATGLMALPLFLMSPWAVGLGVNDRTQRAVWRRAAAFGGILGVAIAGVLVVSTSQIGCRRITFPDGVIEAGAVGAAVGASFAIAVVVAAALLHRHAILSLLASGATHCIGLSFAFYLFTTLYPVASCPKL